MYLFKQFIIMVCIAILMACGGSSDETTNNSGQVNSPPSFAGVPKTGQTASFAKGDDGNLQKGIALPTPRFTDNGNGTVTDNLTRLIWLKNASCQVGAKNWQGAIDFVAGINAGIYNCGDTSNTGSNQTDWRLPNVRELHSLVDYSRNDPALTAGHPFTNFRQVYWSSSSAASNSAVKWVVCFGGIDRAGSVLNVLRTDTVFFDYIYVIAVRGGV